MPSKGAYAYTSSLKTAEKIPRMKIFSNDFSTTRKYSWAIQVEHKSVDGKSGENLKRFLIFVDVKREKKMKTWNTNGVRFLWNIRSWRNTRMYTSVDLFIHSFGVLYLEPKEVSLVRSIIAFHGFGQFCASFEASRMFVILVCKYYNRMEKEDRKWCRKMEYGDLGKFERRDFSPSVELIFMVRKIYLRIILKWRNSVKGCTWRVIEAVKDE